ncbi:MAG: shikimate dehydrogenase [Gammaproteobacteria bacterium]|nr:shikimate dehydrogenase [Gammaproteobacteria bacterium]
MDRYAVIGQPVAHSLSPNIHRLFAEQTDQDLTYDKLPAPVDGFAAAAEAFFASGGNGLNVTVPFKSVAARWVDELDKVASAAGAVNTIVTQSGRSRGYNTDGVGLTRDLCDNLGWEIGDKSLLVLGAGGAVRGIIRSLLSLQPRSLTLANRTVETAQSLIAELRNLHSNVEVEFCALDATDAGYDLVVNGTSAGLSGEGALVVERTVQGAFCYDLVYSAQAGVQTPFCAWASDVGAAGVSDGLGMLVEQAAQAFYLWRGVRPETAPVIAELRGRRSRRG